MPSAEGSVGRIVQWLRGFWTFYHGYVHTAAHAASAAALTAFGLLAFLDRLFVVLAIAAYVGPPLVLYTLGSSGELTSVPTSEAPADRGPDHPPTSGGSRSGADAEAVAPDEIRSGDSDADTDGRDGDADTDGRDGDADADGRDTDADADGADFDSGGDDGDTDSDG